MSNPKNQSKEDKESEKERMRERFFSFSEIEISILSLFFFFSGVVYQQGVEELGIAKGAAGVCPK